MIYEECGVQDYQQRTVIREPLSFRSSNNQTQLSGFMWHVPELKARGVLQIIHGMLEFSERYERFANYLAQRAYIVVAYDQIGHGMSATKAERGNLEWGTGAHSLIEDVHRLRNIMIADYPDLPYYLLGHSMGSFIVRNYIQDYSDGLSGVILSGTAWMDERLLNFAQKLTALLCKLKGQQSRMKLLDALTLGGYARPFLHESPYAWLTRDKDIQQSQEVEKRNKFSFSLAAYHELFFLISRTQEERLISRCTKSLPILIASGSEDPVGHRGAGPKELYQRLKQLSFADVQLILYEGARHEPLNELNYQDVYADIFSWLERRYEL